MNGNRVLVITLDLASATLSEIDFIRNHCKREPGINLHPCDAQPELPHPVLPHNSGAVHARPIRVLNISISQQPANLASRCLVEVDRKPEHVVRTPQ